MSNAADRCAVLEDAVLRKSADDDLAAEGGLFGQSETNPAVNAVDEFGGHLSASADDAKESRTPCFSVSFAGSVDHSAGRSVGRRHHVHSDVSRVHVPGGDHRLAQSIRDWLAAIKQFGEQFLFGRVEPGVGKEEAGDLQHGSGCSIHESDLHGPVGVGGRADQHGRERSGVGQRVHRAAVVEREVRERVPARLSDGAAIASRLESVLRVLLSGASASVVGVSDAGDGVSSKSSEKHVIHFRAKWGGVFGVGCAKRRSTAAPCLWRAGGPCVYGLSKKLRFLV